MKRVAIYVRVSTQDQSTELQLRELKELAARRGWEISAILEDQGKTGTNTRRPGLQQLLSLARVREIDLILVWKLDRFARSLSDLIVHLQEFQDLGVEFVSLKDNLDMTTAAGRLMTQIIGAFAEFEASIIKERVRAGLANAKAKGVRLGRRSTIDPHSIAALRAEGFTPPQIARKLKVSRSAVYAVLKGTL